MAYSEELAKQVRKKLAGTKGLTEQEMFGGVSFLVTGNMCCGVWGEDLMVKIRPDLHQDALTRPHTRETGATGRAVRGTIYVDRDGWEDPTEFELWVNLGVARAKSQPPKAKKRAAKKKPPAKKTPAKKKLPAKKAKPTKKAPAKKRAKR